MPARRVEAEQRLEPVREPARDRDLLLVAAREPAHLPLGARVDRERVDRALHAPALLAHADRPPAARAVEPRGGDVLARSSAAAAAPAAGRPARGRRRRGSRRRDGAHAAASRWTRMSPPVWRCWPESTSKSSSWPCPSSAAIPRISPGRSANDTSVSVSPTLEPAHLERRRHRRGPRSAPAPGSPRRRRPHARPPRRA